jgi:Protein of unknown function (DUF3300)
MKTISRMAWIPMFALLLAAASAFAQAPSPQERPSYPQEELDRMLAPIALYPDSLLSQVLMAATYPLEVVQAARWSRSNPGIRGDDAVRAADDNDWDPSVKSLVAFPQILSMMDEKLDWTQRLGEAFLGQEEQVMQTVQDLRRRARARGNLSSNEQLVVQQQGNDIVMEPPTPDMVYVPYYDPRVIYGPWWWPSSPPIYWDPWLGYSWSPGFAGFGWGLGIAVGGEFFFGAFDWSHHHVRVTDRRPFYFHGVDRRPIAMPGNVWRHDPDHRRGVPYRNPNLRQQYSGWSAAPDGRGEYRGHDRPATPMRTEPVARPGSTGFFDSRGTERANPIARPGTAASTPAPQYRAARPAPEQPPHVFEGVGRGQETRNFSARGQQSLPSRPSAPPAASTTRPAAPTSAARPSGGAPPSRPSGGHPTQR